MYVVSVSCKKTFLSRNNNIEKLSVKLYDIACHLQLASDGVTCEYFMLYIIYRVDGLYKAIIHLEGDSIRLGGRLYKAWRETL